MNRQAFEKTYRDHYGQVFRYSLAATGNADWAEEVTAETFFRLLRHSAGSDRAIRKPLAWLIRVARNLVLDLHKRSNDLPEARPSGPVHTPEQTLLSSEMHRRVLQAIGELSDRQRDCITLRELGGLSYAEISEALGIGSNEVRVHLHRARRHLRKKLEKWL